LPPLPPLFAPSRLITPPNDKGDHAPGDTKPPANTDPPGNTDPHGNTDPPGNTDLPTTDPGPTAVAEPGSLVLLGLSCIGFLALQRRRARAVPPPASPREQSSAPFAAIPPERTSV
jgi:hypothetical protein